MANQVLYGFLEHKDIFAERLNTINIAVVDTAIQRSVDEHNRQMAAISGLFVSNTTDYTARFQTANVSRLQPLDDNGRARPIRPGGFYDVAWPIQEAGTAWGANYVARQKMTVGDANRITATMLDSDMRWMRDHIIAALLTNVTWQWIDPQWGTLTIQPLANGDTVPYQIMTGSDQAATDSHYYAQAAAIADGANNALKIAYDDLVEHPENSGEVVALIASDLVPSITGMANFVTANDPNITPGLGTAQLSGSLGVALPGRLLGYEKVSKVWVSEWKGLPSGYFVAVTTGGDKPVRMREDPEPVLQGFKRVAVRSDHPFEESQYLRRAGFGGWNRVGAFVARIGNASYAIPTGYASPQP